MTFPEKKKARASAKPKNKTTHPKPADIAIQTHPAPEPAATGPEPVTPFDNPPETAATPAKPVYEWDRTQAEAEEQQKQLVISRTPFPIPNARTLPFDKFCEYWNALIKLPTGKYGRVYIRRWWPVLLPDEIEDPVSGLSKQSHPSETTLTSDAGPLNEERLLDAVGVGDYTMRLNDNRRGWTQGTILHCEMYRTHRDFDKAAPLLDVKRLDWEDASNNRYIKWGQAKGVLPRPDQIRKETDEMATVTERAFTEAEQARARADQIQQEQLNRARADADAAKAETARVTAEAEQAKRQAEELKSKVQPGTPAAELLSVVSSVATLAQSLKPATDNSLEKFLALEAQREETRRIEAKEERDAARAAAKEEKDKAERLQAEVIALKTAPPVTPTVTAAVPQTRRQMLEDAVAEQALMKQLGGRGGSAQAEEEDKPGRTERFLELAAPMVPVIQAFVQGIFSTAQYVVKTWGDVSYNNALSKNGGAPQAPTAMTQPNAEHPTGQAATSGPIKPTDPPPDPVEQARQAQWKLITEGIVKLAPHLVRFLEKGKTGDQLADFIIENADEQRSAYDRMRHLSQTLEAIQIPAAGATDLEKFINACRFVFQQIPQLWAKVGTLPTMKQFLTDFYNYDEILAAQNEDQQTQ